MYKETRYYWLTLAPNSDGGGLLGNDSESHKGEELGHFKLVSSRVRVNEATMSYPFFVALYHFTISLTRHKSSDVFFLIVVMRDMTILKKGQYQYVE